MCASSIVTTGRLTASPDDFQVYEDGVPQRVFLFHRRTSARDLWLAVDTSGSLRSQINEVIDAAKTIINSNKPATKRFSSASSIATRSKTFRTSRQQRRLAGRVDNLYVEGGKRSRRRRVPRR
jgi:hypothetical protein